MFKVYFIVIAMTLFSFAKAQVKLSKQVFSNAATRQSSGNLRLNGSVGQSIIFTTSDNSISNHQGFWPAYQKLFVSQSDGLQNFGINIYPNPVAEIITIESKEFILNNVQLYDVYGNLVLEVPTTSVQSKLSFNIENLPASTYLLYLSNSKGRLKSMIVKL